ncbi:hypothetical protein [Marinobacter zhanjiangensis]|uniref:Uncharacterized protein n=1 Tax=Marinobacter zhanjiangensis TaxID=578215 RepID=A0ABQ3B3C9_9GAMM|nr:hypothetical protein [Marinobacter zhanjiangensis]GGY76541.1 hypothetical protein GCM10007071_25080 [Marinobacter zhanjiangensis]
MAVGDHPRSLNLWAENQPPRIMMVREASMPWGDVQSLLKKLSLANQNFSTAPAWPTFIHVAAIG